ncbi:hypothetical protein QQ045_030049 [Rhodiola kirilowii]
MNLCGATISDEDMLEKTLSTFHANNLVLQQQYNICGFKTYSELLSCLILAEENNQLLLNNHHTRPTGSTPLPDPTNSMPEANATSSRRGCGRGHTRGRGRDRRGGGGRDGVGQRRNHTWGDLTKKSRLSQSLASEIYWHASPIADVHRRVHPSDGESWKHFDWCHPNFASESRNVRLGLCTDGFNPWGMSIKQYSVWPVMVTPYNLPPWLCMKMRFIWLTILRPGLSNPKKRLDIYLKPYIDALVQPWNVGVDTYDANRKQSFTLRAALMWTVSDFHAYAMLSG